MTLLINLLIKTLLDTIAFTGIIILFGLILGFFSNHIVRNFQKRFSRSVLMISGVIGVPIHELSHALVALFFAHKVTDIKLIQKPDEFGTMGYVKHSYKQGNIYQQVGNLFIGIAPIFGGTLSIIALMYFIIPNAFSKYITILYRISDIALHDKISIIGILRLYFELVQTIFSLTNFKNPYFYIFLFVNLCISSHISLSYADIQGASKGLGFILVLFLIWNILNLTGFIDPVNLIKLNIILSGFLMIAVIFSAVSYLFSLIFT